MNDLFIHPYLHPCRTGWENEKTNSGASCRLQQARTRRRRVWMRISFLFIHPNVCNSITVSKRPAGWRMNATHGWANNESTFHTSIYSSIHIQRDVKTDGALNPHQQRKMSNQAMFVFHPFFSFFFIQFCGMRIVQSRRGWVLFSLQNKKFFLRYWRLGY
jgi:hypothetical protein